MRKSWPLLLLLAGCASPRPARPSLHDRLGGTHAIAAVCQEFLARLLANPKIAANPNVARVADPARGPGLWFHLTAQIVEATGGPYRYSGRTMKDVHHGMNITAGEWDAMTADFKATLDQFKVPEAEQKELFDVVGTTRKDIVTHTSDAPKRPDVTGSSLYARLGGTYPIAAVCQDFLARLVRNPVIMANPKVAARVKPERAPGLLFHLIAQVVEATGGPGKYAGKPMREVHTGMAITEKEWEAMVADFQATLDQFKVPAREQEELRKIIESTKADIVGR